MSTLESKKLITILRCLIESLTLADGDLCGEVREWHLPRIRKATVELMKIYPKEAATALDIAKRPDGSYISSDEETSK